MERLRITATGNCLRKSFLSGVRRLCSIATGNCLRMVSYSAWDDCESLRLDTIRREISRLRFASLEMTSGGGNCCASKRQETVCEKFLIRHVTIAYHSDRKLFAKGFLPDMERLRIIATGNCLRKVSCSTWADCIVHRQETISERFPIRHGTIAYHSGRKLLTDGFLSGVRRLCSIATGNCLRMVSRPT